MAGIGTAEGDDRLVAILVGITQVEAEHGLINKALVDHVVEWRSDPVDGDTAETHTHDAVEATKGESKARLAGSFSKELFLDSHVTDLDIVPRDKAL